jgi:hypothetical protein
MKLNKIAPLAIVIILASPGAAFACKKGVEKTVEEVSYVRDDCKNIDGIQTEIPEGYVKDGRRCTPIIESQPAPEQPKETTPAPQPEAQPAVVNTPAPAPQPISQPAPTVLAPEPFQGK